MIPVNTPNIGEREKALLAECIDTGWISSEGPFVEEFEYRMAAQAGREFGIAVCNGTAALDIAVAALDIGPGDEVILPTFTIISCVQQVVRAGAYPIFIDCDPETWNIRVDQVEERVTPRTKAIIAAHIFGLPTDMHPLMDVAKRHGLAIIEDTAQAIGQTYRGRACGSFGDLSTLSFYPNKLLTTGEGGMVLTDSPELAQRCKSLRNLCFQSDKRFIHEELGWNYRITNMQAALGIAQLERMQESIDRKREVGRFYKQAFEGLPKLQLPLAKTDYADNLYWVYGLVLHDSCPFDAAGAIKRLAAKGVGARPFFWPLHEQPVLHKMGLAGKQSHPVAERLARRGFYLPGGLGITQDQLQEVSNVVKEIFQ